MATLLTAAPDAPGATSLPGRLRRRVAKVAEAAVTPLQPADILDLFHPLRAGAELRGKITAIKPETADAATIEIKPGKDWAGHIPGQYVRIGIDVDGVRQWRAYSLTHGPRPDGRIAITVKAVPDGLVSTFLVHQARVGTMVHLDQAAGEFVLDSSHRKLLFVTAGSGITPVIGMLRNLFPVTDAGVVNRGRGLDIVVVHVAPSEPHSIFIGNLHELHESGAIRLIARYDDVHGMLSVDQICDLVDDVEDRVTYACGPAGLLDALAGHHHERGLALQTERFRVDRVDLDGAVGGTVTLTTAAGTTELDVPGDTPILDLAEAAGVLVPSGCRMGICMTCKIPMTDGSVRDLRNGEVTTVIAGETDPVLIQTCISAAAGGCSLSLSHPLEESR
ncbi:NADPH oxidoreductase [soil metagenome]